MFTLLMDKIIIAQNVYIYKCGLNDRIKTQFCVTFD
jgi:hypothetical protein